MAPETNGWSKAERYVIAELERQSKAITRLEASLASAATSSSVEALHTKLDDLRVEVVQLKVRASIWSGAIGFIAGLIPLVIKMLMGT